MTISARFHPARTHEDLGPSFFDPVEAARFPNHILRVRNQVWAERIGLGELTEHEWVRHFGEFQPLPGSLPQPLALRYHGHQFRHYNPDLGDGRGFLFAQMCDLADGRLLDLATKGSGQTPWSRAGDGRLTLKGGVREVLASEMLDALGVNTSKSFSLIETGERLMRGDEPSPTRSSVLVRLSHSHIRIGTFQRLAYLGETDQIAALLHHSVAHYLPACQRPTIAETAVAVLRDVVVRVANMGAQWMLAGFVHGVLNTDNINITGESFDYGPWRFIPELEPGFTAAYFDQQGLYAFGRQPDALLWNLTRFAECLMPLADKTALETTLGEFQPALQAAFATSMLRRLGLAPMGAEADRTLAREVWSYLTKSRTAFEQFFFDWYGGDARADRAKQSPAAASYASDEFGAVRTAMQGHTPMPNAKLDHPYFNGSEPCTMLIDEVEAIWLPIAAQDDWSVFEAKRQQIALMADAFGNAAQPVA